MINIKLSGPETDPLRLGHQQPALICIIARKAASFTLSLRTTCVYNYVTFHFFFFSNLFSQLFKLFFFLIYLHHHVHSLLNKDHHDPTDKCVSVIINKFVGAERRVLTFIALHFFIACLACKNKRT